MNSTFTTVTVLIITVAMSFLRKYKPLQNWLAGKIETSLSNLNQFSPISTDFQLRPSPNFSQNLTLRDLSNSLTQLQEYQIRGIRQNGVIYQRVKDLNETSKQQLRDLEYFDKVEEVNQSVRENSLTTNAIIEYTLTSLIKNNPEEQTAKKEIETVCRGLGYQVNHGGLNRYSQDVVLSSGSNQHRVNEAIAHICRDWHSDFDVERKPLREYILSRLKKLPKKDTLVVVPGAGVGNMAYEIAKVNPHSRVDSVELSTLMYLCNEFVLGHNSSVTIRPYAQHYSCQLTAKDQMRKLTLDLSDFSKPANLNVHLGDFCKYQPTEQYDQIVVCSVFFVDTAENIFDYFEAIEELKGYTKELHWINVGPLKYGTRPLVQFTAEELAKLRRLRGWKDIHCQDDVKNLNGYLTNKSSLYQGFYGSTKFHSVYRK